MRNSPGKYSLPEVTALRNNHHSESSFPGAVRSISPIRERNGRSVSTTGTSRSLPQLKTSLPQSPSLVETASHGLPRFDPIVDAESRRRYARLASSNFLRDCRAEQQRAWLKTRKKESTEFTPDQRRMLRKWFDSMDADGSGEISVDELQDPLMSTGIARNRQEVEYVVSTVDDDGSGEIGFEEFLRLLKPKYGKGEEYVDNNAILRLKEVVSDSSSKEGGLSITNTVSEQRRKLLLNTITTMYQVPKSNKKDCNSSLRSPRNGESERTRMEKKLLTLDCLDNVVGRLVESAERDDNPFISLPQKQKSGKVTASESAGRRSIARKSSVT